MLEKAKKWFNEYMQTPGQLTEEDIKRIKEKAKLFRNCKANEDFQPLMDMLSDMMDGYRKMEHNYTVAGETRKAERIADRIDWLEKFVNQPEIIIAKDESLKKIMDAKKEKDNKLKEYEDNYLHESLNKT